MMSKTEYVSPFMPSISGISSVTIICTNKNAFTDIAILYLGLIQWVYSNKVGRQS